VQRAGELAQQWVPMAARLETVLTRDVAAFNAKVQALGVAPIVVPRRGRPIG
jgi:hypothetical protein